MVLVTRLAALTAAVICAAALVVPHIPTPDPAPLTVAARTVLEASS